jgi:hypothetical protein
MERIFLIIAVVVLGLAGSALMLAQGPDPFVGTWKLNLAKSKYTGAAAPKSDTLTFEAQGNGLRLTRDGIAADGSRIAYSFATSLDGKPVPVSGSGTPGGADMEAVKRINSNTTTATYTKAGKVVATTRNVVSKDGKVMTITVKATNATGQPVNTVAVYDKQ